MAGTAAARKGRSLNLARLIVGYLNRFDAVQNLPKREGGHLPDRQIARTPHLGELLRGFE